MSGAVIVSSCLFRNLFLHFFFGGEHDNKLNLKFENQLNHRRILKCVYFFAPFCWRVFIIVVAVFLALLPFYWMGYTRRGDGSNSLCDVSAMWLYCKSAYIPGIYSYLEYNVLSQRVVTCALIPAIPNQYIQTRYRDIYIWDDDDDYDDDTADDISRYIVSVVVNGWILGPPYCRWCGEENLKLSAAQTKLSKPARKSQLFFSMALSCN